VETQIDYGDCWSFPLVESRRTGEKAVGKRRGEGKGGRTLEIEIVTLVSSSSIFMMQRSGTGIKDPSRFDHRFDLLPGLALPSVNSNSNDVPERALAC